MIKKLFCFFILFLIITLSFVTHAHAQEGFIINSFDSAITVQSTGNLSVIETLIVDFGTTQHHGIYRDIPNVYQDQTGQQTYLNLTVTSVSTDSQSTLYTVSQNNNYDEIKIGNPQILLSGQHTYVISYLVTGALRSYGTYDELFWNVTGNNWPVPITHASATVTLPQPGIEKLTCFVGITGSTTPCSEQQINTQQAKFQTQGQLNPQEGLTLVLGYTKGMVPIVLGTKPQKQQSNWSFNWQLFFLTSGIGIIFFLFLLARNKNGPFSLLQSHPAVVVEYEPPDNLRPGELGTVMDERADTLDVTATIIDLAARGYLTIKEIEKTWIFGTKDYLLSSTKKDATQLRSYEQKLLDSLFGQSQDVLISSLKVTFYQSLIAIKHALYADVVALNLFSQNPESVRGKYIGIGIACIIIGAILMKVGPFSMGIGLILPGILFLICSNSFAKRSQKGTDMYQRGLGYKLFITEAERYRQQYFEKENILNEVLPYAIIFGATKKFAQALKNMGIKPIQPTWYYGPTVFDPYLFSQNITTFSNSFSSAIAATPKGSGFSGGGFSGGGFGGGGGGSW